MRLDEILHSANEPLWLAVRQIRWAAEKIWAAPQHRWYTQHTVEHSDRIIVKLEHLTAGMMRLEAAQLSPGEIYVLLAAAYLHDIGMQDEQFAHGDLEAIRDQHHELTAQMIIDGYANQNRDLPLGLFRDSTLTTAVAKVARSHRRGSLDGNEYDDTQWGDDRIRPCLLSALLRFGDELDIDHNRVIIENFALAQPDAKTVFYWFKCHYVSGVSIKAEDIQVHYRFPDMNYDTWLPRLVEEQITKHFVDLQPIFRKNGIRAAIAQRKVQLEPIQQMPPEAASYGRRLWTERVRSDLDETQRKLAEVERVSKAHLSVKNTEQIDEARKVVTGLVERPESVTPQDLAGTSVRVNELYSELLVGFVNRDDETRFLSQSVVNDGPDFTIVTAPADYGKSFLLKRVEEKLHGPDRPRWVIARCDDLTSESTLETILHTILMKLRLGHLASQQAGYFSPKDRLLAGLEESLRQARPAAMGAVLLLDGVEVLPASVSKALRQMLEAVNHDLWKSRRCRLRVILAMRYIPPEWEGLGIEYGLTPFTAAVVGDAIDSMCRRKEIELLPEGERNQLAGEVHWASGGHPAVMVSILDELSQNRFRVTVDSEVRRHWFRKHGRPVVSSLLSAVPEDLRASLRALCVYRWFSAEILTPLLAEGEIQGFSGGDKLLTGLSAAHLCTPPADLGDPGYVDKTHRAPLLAELFFENTPRFQALNERAAQLHDRWLHGRDANGEAMLRPPEVREQLWSLKELIYHLLLLRQTRKTILARVEECLAFLTQGGDARLADFVDRLIGELEKDAEIRWAARQVGTQMYSALLGVVRRCVSRGGQGQ